ncbi:MAG: ATP-binding protein, partial [Candidatus Methylomirabilales bacterium]
PASVAYAPAERLGGWFLLVALGSTAVAVLLGWGLARSFPRPVRHLGEPAEKKMTAGDFAVRVTPASQDEVGPPANSSHSIAEELQESHGEPDWTMEDHTRELEAAKARLEEALRRVEEASQHKSDFLAEMSHELRTPLNAIIGFSELLQGQQFGPLNEKQQRHVDNIWTSGKHLLQLINDILDLSKVEARKIELWPEPFSPRQALEAALNDIRPQAEAKGLRVDLQMDEGLSTIVADPVRFKQILYNLLSNAVKCTPDGGRVTVTAKWVHGSEFRVHRGKEASHEPSTMNHERPRDFLEFAVQDTGIGMKAEDLPKLFREFTQLDASLAKEHQGTGLGLALTKRLVELQGGKIRAESDGEGRGSTFTVILPIRPPRRARPRLLLVDDDVGVVQAIATALKQTGYTVETVADGQEALARVAQRPPDLLLLDVILPGLDGRDILAALRRREATRRLPVIAFTGVEGVGEKEVRALGADEFLTKPFSTTALLRMIGSFLDSGTWATTPDPPPSA